MSRSDYQPCARCARKAFYDADTDYGKAHDRALCSECAEHATLTVVEMLPTDRDRLPGPRIGGDLRLEGVLNLGEQRPQCLQCRHPGDPTHPNGDQK